MELDAEALSPKVGLKKGGISDNKRPQSRGFGRIPTWKRPNSEAPLFSRDSP